MIDHDAEIIAELRAACVRSHIAAPVQVAAGTLLAILDRLTATEAQGEEWVQQSQFERKGRIAAESALATANERADKVEAERDSMRERCEQAEALDTLVPEIGSFGHMRVIRRDNGDVSLMIANIKGIGGVGLGGEVEFRASSLSEAIAAAILAPEVTREGEGE